MERGRSDAAGRPGTAARVAEPRHALPERIPLAVVVVAADGRISHWSSGAHRLFGPGRAEAVGTPALDLMPVTGALGDTGAEGCDGHGGPHASSGGRTSYPTAGRARVTTGGAGPVDLLWWAYPLAAPGPGPTLVLAADTALLPDGPGGPGAGGERWMPGFARHTGTDPTDADLRGAAELVRRSTELLPDLSPGLSARIVARVLELGCPVLEISCRDGRATELA
ncbi:PAS domain-containing protein [Streptomyces sp. N2A]|uniref:PAS domain-containing protein n=1 Tax=Streptomyces sp. N2A TaxID=3073936 RepID=UPI0028709055|nr:PAS domain-containing protein [Streptomyces sp. N2A]